MVTYTKLGPNIKPDVLYSLLQGSLKSRTALWKTQDTSEQGVRRNLLGLISGNANIKERSSQAQLSLGMLGLQLSKATIRSCRVLYQECTIVILLVLESHGSLEMPAGKITVACELIWAFG